MSMNTGGGEIDRAELRNLRTRDGLLRTEVERLRAVLLGVDCWQCGWPMIGHDGSKECTDWHQKQTARAAALDAFDTPKGKKS